MHLKRYRTDYDRVYWGYGFVVRNGAGERELDFTLEYKITVVYTSNYKTIADNFGDMIFKKKYFL